MSAEIERDAAILVAVRGELDKVAAGMMGAMAALGMLVCASGNITNEEFLSISRKVAGGLRNTGDVGDAYGARLLDGMCERIGAAQKDPVATESRRVQ